MDLVISFWIVIIIFAVALAFVLIKSLIKALMFSLLIISLILSVGAFFVVKDAIDIKNNFMLQEKLVVLKDQDNVLAAFTFINLSMKDGEKLNALTADKFADIEESIKKEDFSQFNEAYYKTVVFDYSAFNLSTSKGLTFNFGNDEISLSKDDLKKIFDSEKPVDMLFSKYAEAKKIDLTLYSPENKEKSTRDLMNKLGISSQEQFKSYLFAYMIENMVKAEGPLELISKIKNGEISIYPNTAIFKGIKLIPTFLISKIMDKLQQKMATQI